MSLVLPSVQARESRVTDTVMMLVYVCKQAAIKTISDGLYTPLWCDSRAFHTALNPGLSSFLTPLLTPGKDTFHTCNLKAVLAPAFYPGLWNPAPEQG